MSRRSRGKLKRFLKDGTAAENQPVQVGASVAAAGEVPKKEEHQKEHHISHYHSPGDYKAFKFPKLAEFYDKNYKKLMIIPMLMVILALCQIGYQYSTTGDFLLKGVSLKGGVSVTYTYAEEIDSAGLEKFLSSRGYEASVRVMENAGKPIGFVVDATIDFQNKEQMDTLLQTVSTYLNHGFTKNDYSIEGVGSTLGESFFKQTILAVLLAFLFMSIVVFLYFRLIIPSLAVILCAFSDIVVTLAIVNILGIHLSTAGVAAFLMLIGYSVDTDMVLTTRALKQKFGTVFDRIISAVKTGMTMIMTTLAAVTVSLIFINNDVIKQIMIIIFIGLVVDIIMTWIQNVGLVRIYAEKKGIK